MQGRVAAVSTAVTQNQAAMLLRPDAPVRKSQRMHVEIYIYRQCDRHKGEQTVSGRLTTSPLNIPNPFKEVYPKVGTMASATLVISAAVSSAPFNRSPPGKPSAAFSFTIRGNFRPTVCPIALSTCHPSTVILPRRWRGYITRFAVVPRY